MPYILWILLQIWIELCLWQEYIVYVTGESTRERFIFVADDNNHDSSESSTKTVIS